MIKAGKDTCFFLRQIVVLLLLLILNYKLMSTKKKKSSKNFDELNNFNQDGNALADKPNSEHPNPFKDESQNQSEGKNESITQDQNENKEEKTEEEILAIRIQAKRKNIDLLIQAAAMAGLEQVEDSLFLAKSWLGKSLGAVGVDNPYANEHKIKTATDIPPTADTNNDTAYLRKFSLENELDKVLALRKEIEILLNDTIVLNSPYPTLSVRELEKARFYLGKQLSILKK